MGAIDRLINAMKINPDPEDYDEGMMDDLGGYEEAPAPRGFGSKKRSEEYEAPAEPRPSRSFSRPSMSKLGPGMEVCVIKPTSVEDARQLTDTLLDNQTVVLNLEGLDVDIAQRIIDFTSGSCYAIRGKLMKISHYIFVVTPESVDISGDITASMGMDDSHSQQGGYELPYSRG